MASLTLRDLADASAKGASPFGQPLQSNFFAKKCRHAA